MMYFRILYKKQNKTSQISKQWAELNKITTKRAMHRINQKSWLFENKTKKPTKALVQNHSSK